LVQKLVDVGAFIGNHRNSNKLVFERDAAKLAKDAFGNSASAVSLTYVRNIALAFFEFHGEAFRRFRELMRPQVLLHAPESSSAQQRSHACPVRLPAMRAAGSRPFPKPHGGFEENLSSEMDVALRPACR